MDCWWKINNINEGQNMVAFHSLQESSILMCVFLQSVGLKATICKAGLCDLSVGVCPPKEKKNSDILVLMRCFCAGGLYWSSSSSSASKASSWSSDPPSHPIVWQLPHVSRRPPKWVENELVEMEENFCAASLRSAQGKKSQKRGGTARKTAIRQGRSR